MVTLKDIANEVGVSMSLVSKVLNNRLGTTNVSQPTVDMIKEAAARMGYSKNSSALALSSGRHDCIGVFLHCSGLPGSGIMEGIIKGISECSLRYHKRLNLCFFNDMQSFMQIAEFAKTSKMDGLLVGNIQHAFLKDVLLNIQKEGLPVVTMLDEQIHPDITNININQNSIGELATRHLIEEGCRNIVTISDFPARKTGYKMALEKAGLIYDPKKVFIVKEHDIMTNVYDAFVGENAIKYFIDNDIEFDGVFAESDREAMGVINYLLSVGIKVPEEVKVVGVDNSSFCNFVPIPLSSVEQNTEELANIATDILVRKIDGDCVTSVTIQPRLVVRRSSKNC